MITLDNFKGVVSPIILARGEDYYDSGTVTEMEENEPGEWTSIVSGTYFYQVEVKLEGNRITSWHCDCPYDGDDICKHVVATWFALRNYYEKMGSSAFQTKKKRKKEVEEAVILCDESVQNRLDELEKLLSLVKIEDLSKFLLEYATTDVEFQKKFLERFMLKKRSTLKDYRKEVQKCFRVSRRGGSSQYREYDYYGSNWYEIVTKLDAVLEEGELLLSCENVKNASVIALQVLQSIAEEADDELFYNEDCDVSSTCEKAGRLLLAVTQCPKTLQILKDEILKELEQTVKLSFYKNYDYYDIDELLQEVTILSQTTEKALQLIDKLLKEKEDNWKLHKLVFKKIELLLSLGKQEEADKTVHKYLYLQEVRKSEMDKLIKNQQYDEAIHLLDEGIQLAQKNGQAGSIIQWKELKLQVYEIAKRTPETINVCRELFIDRHGELEYYHKLKSLVPKGEWKSFLDVMMKETGFHSSSFYSGRCNEADIYMEEKDNERLFLLLSSIDHYLVLQALVHYAYQLRDTHSEALIILFTSELRRYAEQNMGRQHYEFIAGCLSSMQDLKKGKAAVCELVAEFRRDYKRRSAMMSELKKF